MATLIDKVVEVTLTYGTTVIETARFDIPLILAAHNATGNVVDTFTSSDAILQAGFTTDSPVYKMAVLLFTGVAAPDQVVVGKRGLANFTVGFNVANTTVYDLTLKMGTTSKVFSFTSDATATVAEISNGLQAMVAADATWGTRVGVAVNGNNLVVTPVNGTHVEVGVGSNMTVSRNTTTAILEDLAAVAQVNNTWFWLLSESHTEQVVLNLAAYAQEHDKIYWTSSQDQAVVSATDDNMLAHLKEQGYNNTGFAMWKSDADTTFPEAGVVGAMAAATPGTTTLHGKTLVGVAPEQLTGTQEVNIVSQNGNIYRREYGVNFYRDGRMVTGNFCDTIHHALWVKARVAESLFGLLKRQSDLLSGVRFTKSGLAKVRQAIYDNPINIGILNGSIANEINTSSETGMKEDLRPTIYIPDRSDISTDDITQRILNGVVVEYVYAGFIHYVKVKVNVLVDR